MPKEKVNYQEVYDLYQLCSETKAKSLLEKDVTMTDDHSGQHWEFTKDGIPFEMHYHTAVFASGSRQRYWDELIDSYYDTSLKT